MRILITGGAGFIGAHLANRLHSDGHYVRVLDNLSSGDPAILASGISFTRGDVRDIPKLWSLLQGVDAVYHLAALVSVPASVLYPREYNDVNVGGTVALLEACRERRGQACDFRQQCDSVRRSESQTRLRRFGAKPSRTLCSQQAGSRTVFVYYRSLGRFRNGGFAHL